MKKIQSSYSETFKWQVVEEVLSGKYTKEEARRIYGIKSKSGILEWMRIFGGQDRRSKQELSPELLEMAQKSKKEKALEERIKQLENELNVEKHKALLYAKIVEVAEEELGISIRKKSGARQSDELKKKKK